MTTPAAAITHRLGCLVSMSYRPFAAGGKSLNIRVMALLRLSSFFCGLPDSVFVDVPRHTGSFERASKMSTTSDPTSNVLVIVVAEPNRPPQRQPPPKPS